VGRRDLTNTAKGNGRHGTSLPEIGRTFKRVHIESREATGKAATPYRIWKAVKALGARHESLVRKDANGKDPKTDRSAEIAAAVWEWRVRNGATIAMDEFPGERDAGNRHLDSD